MHTSISLLVLCWVQLSLAGLQTNAGKGDFGEDARTRGTAIYGQMLEAFQRSGSLTYTSDFTFGHDSVILVQSSYQAWLRKPGFVRVEARRYNGELSGVIVGEGDEFWIYWPSGRPRDDGEDSTTYVHSRDRVYLYRPYTADRYSIAHDIRALGTGIPMLVYQPSVFHGAPDPLGNSLDSAVYTATESVMGVECDVIQAFYLGGQRIRRFWISRVDHFPRKIVGLAHTRHELFAEEIWHDVRTDVTLSDTLFSWKPGPDWTPWNLPEAGSRLLAPGTVAPDLVGRTLDGKNVGLSSLRGSPVMLTFWRLGCPPCRLEVPIIQRLSSDSSFKPVIFVGYNYADDPVRVADFLSRAGATYMNLVDTSTARSDACERLFGIVAVPTTYALDSSGIIVESWIGNDPPRFENIARKLASR